MLAYLFFFFNDTATTEIYTLSLHDALPIFHRRVGDDPPDELDQPRHPGQAEREEHHRAVGQRRQPRGSEHTQRQQRSEEHTSELQSRQYLVCRLLLEKKKKITYQHTLNVIY